MQSSRQGIIPPLHTSFSHFPLSPPPPAHRQVPLLHSLKAKGEANGVHDLKLMSGTEAATLEPKLNVG